MPPSHHIHQSRRQLKFATRDTVAGDHAAAASSLARATSHAATAVGIHWDLLAGRRGTRRRLQFALNEMAKRGCFSYSLAGVLRETYALPDLITTTTATAANDDDARREIFRILRRTRMRARRLLKAILKAMADEPNPIAFAETLAGARAPFPAPEPTHSLASPPPAYGAPPSNPLY